MKNKIWELENINYCSIADINYKERAYEILDSLSRSELLEIAKIEDMSWILKSGTDEYIKQEIYDVLVRFRCERQVLGEVAAVSYWE